MAYTNETMPKYVPRIEIDEIRFRQLETEVKFWANKYSQVVDRMENMVDSCKEYGYVELRWENKKFKFTMDEIN